MCGKVFWALFSANFFTAEFSSKINREFIKQIRLGQDEQEVGLFSGVCFSDLIFGLLLSVRKYANQKSPYHRCSTGSTRKMARLNFKLSLN